MLKKESRLVPIGIPKMWLAVQNFNPNSILIVQPFIEKTWTNCSESLCFYCNQ